MTTTKNNKATLERIIELQQNEFYWKGLRDEKDQIVESRKNAADEYRELCESLKKDYKSFKKGDKILLVVSPNRFKKVGRKDLFLSRGEKAPERSFIVEVEVAQPIKTRIQKNKWVGDGYEDTEVMSFKYIDEQYIVSTPFPMSLHMVKCS